MTHHSLKPYDFIKLKKVWQRNIFAIHSFNKTAIQIDDILDPRPKPLAGTVFLARDPITSLIFEIWTLVYFWNCTLTLNSENAPRKIVDRAAGRGAGRPDLLLPHIHEVLFEPILAVAGRVACALCAGLFPCSYLSCSHQLTRISRSSRSNNFFELPFIIVNGVLIEVSIAHSLIHGKSGVKSEYYPALVAPCG